MRISHYIRMNCAQCIHNSVKLKLTLRQYISCMDALKIYIIKVVTSVMIKVSGMRITVYVMNTPSVRPVLKLY